MSAADRIASGVAKHLSESRPPKASTRDLIEQAFRRGYELGRSVRAPTNSPPRLLPQPTQEARRLILACECAASRRNPRDRDPTRWKKSAWRRYLYTAAHAPSLVDLERIFGQ